MKPPAKDTELSPEAISEEKKAANAMRLYTSNKNYRMEHREEYNAYMRTIMRENYRNDAVHRARQVELAQLRLKKNIEAAKF